MDKPKVLYVDDELPNLFVFEANFEDDYEVLTASSGQEALEILAEEYIPVVVADQRMPGMTGAQLFTKMYEQFPGTQRIMLTGFSEPEAIVDAINKGHIFHFLRKPWDKQELQSVLNRALEMHQLTLANQNLTDRLVVSERFGMLGQATARITHEMGNQLCILPLLELIEEKYPNHEDLVQIAKFARVTHQRLNNLIEEVKSVIRCDQEQFHTQPIPVSDAVRELITFLRFDKTIPNDGVQVKIVKDSIIKANKMKIQQVLVNLVKNAAFAIQDAPDGKITINIDREGEESVLKIEDTGCGMSEEVLGKIWEPFYTTKGDEGNGMGLDISKKLIENHGGTIQCASQEGVGTTFEIRLPAVELLDCFNNESKTLERVM